VVVIAPIALDNAESYRACLEVVAREGRYLAQLEALPMERIREFVRDSVQADAVQFVALDGARVVGWADIFTPWQPVLAHCGSLGMGVLPLFRGKGIGEGLLAACIAKARTKGITRIELETRVDNERAIRLYEKLGFVVEARKKNAMRFDGVYYDAFQMCLIQA
jgi:ribosomal protein S18 acetylase RimI-like enzyme